MSSAIYAINDVLRDDWKNYARRPTYTIRANKTTITAALDPYRHPYLSDVDTFPTRYANIKVDEDNNLADNLIILVARHQPDPPLVNLQPDPMLRAFEAVMELSARDYIQLCKTLNAQWENDEA